MYRVFCVRQTSRDTSLVTSPDTSPDTSRRDGLVCGGNAGEDLLCEMAHFLWKNLQGRKFFRTFANDIDAMRNTLSQSLSGYQSNTTQWKQKT